MRNFVFDFSLDRSLLEGLAGKSDKELAIEWICDAAARAFSAVPASWLDHQILRSIVEAVSTGGDRSVEITPIEHTFLRHVFLVARYPTAVNNLYCQYLAKLGLAG